MGQTQAEREIFRRALSEVIREKRQSLNLSLTQLGSKSGLSQQSVSYVEREKRYPNVETLLRIANALNSDLSVLIREVEVLTASRLKGPINPRTAAKKNAKAGKKMKP